MWAMTNHTTTLHLTMTRTTKIQRQPTAIDNNKTKKTPNTTKTQQTANDIITNTTPKTAQQPTKRKKQN